MREQEMREEQENIWDTPTGIYNRKGFYQATQELFDRNPDTKYVIADWNVQRFKIINELRALSWQLLIPVA